MVAQRAERGDNVMSSADRRNPGRRRRIPAVEGLESRQVLSASAGNVAAGATLPDGVDALAIGDVNGDRIADIAVAGRQAGQYSITIYDGRGGGVVKSPVATPLLPQYNPLSGGGPLSIALGDFAGDGVSELAVASTAAGSTPTVAIVSFQLAGSPASPMDAPVQESTVTKFTPPGLEGAQGLQLAAADVNGDGIDELIVGPAHGGAQGLAVMAEPPGGGAWQLRSWIGLTASDMAGGVSLAAGPLRSATAQVVVGSQTDGKVQVIDPRTGAVQRTIKALGSYQGPVRVAVASAVNQRGAIVVTPASSSARSFRPALVKAGNWHVTRFKAAASPGAGALVPLGAGAVYQRATIQSRPGAFSYSNGPVTSSVILGSERGTSLVVQGVPAAGASPIVEPVLSAAPAGTAFTPLQEPGDMPDLPAPYATPAIAYPRVSYHSPYRLDLSSAPATISQGLPSTATFTVPNSGGWGPLISQGTPPPTALIQGTEWLRQRLLTAYGQAIGVAYQHHHNPYWLPRQGSLWNAVALGYQSRGIDCTNFTAFAYNDALGILMNSATTIQAAITPQNVGTIESNGLPNISIPQALNPYVSVQVLPGPTGPSASDYEAFVKSLQPGDILFINPNSKTYGTSDPAACAHAITWLGQYGVDANHLDKYLIIDSTGDQPAHIDSNDHAIKPGVQIRPFAAPNPQQLNDWYYQHVDHVLRIIATTPT